MKASKTLHRIKLVAATLLFVAVSAYATTDKPGDKRINFTTKSTEAKDYVAQFVKMVETFQAGPQALPLAQKIIAADPEFAFGHYLVGVATPPPQGLPIITKAFEMAKNASEGERRYIEAIIKLRTQKPLEALAIFEELAKQYPDDRMVQMMLGQVYPGQGKFDEARAALERAIQLDGSTPRAYAFLGNIHLLKGNYSKAEEMFKYSLSKKVPNTAAFQASYGLAYTHVYRGDVKGALKVLNEFHDDYNKSGQQANFPPVFIWNSIGRLLLENGQPAESIKAYEKGYETVPASNMSENDKKTWLGRLHHGKGRALAKMGKHEEAWKEAELIKKMIDEGGEPGKQFLPAYHYIAGYLKLEAKEYDKAIEHLKQADQTDPFQKLLLARAYEKAGDQASAQKLYKEITEYNVVNLERALAYPEAKKKLKA